MNKNPILIRNINHLTDARYFAAMGVDWMSMPLTHDPQSYAMWHTLSEWISGVKLAAEVDVNDEMLLAKTIIDAKPEGIVANQFVPNVMPSNAQLFLEVNSIPERTDLLSAFLIMPYDPEKTNLLKSETTSKGLFLFADWTKDSLEKLLATGYQGGICFAGGEEEEVGVRDFELMDELLEMVQ